MPVSLQQSFSQLCFRFTEEEALVLGMWQELEAHYSEKNRHYHSLNHIEDLLEQANAFETKIVDFEVLQFTIWYHDIIYSQYADKVRKEYKIYPNFLYRKGRKKALQNFCDRERIYATDHYFDQYESTARTNLQREIKML